MAKGKKPDYRVMFPVNGTKSNGPNKETKGRWHRLGVAWRRDGGSIGVVLDVGVAITLQPGAQLVLCQEETKEPGPDN